MSGQKFKGLAIAGSLFVVGCNDRAAPTSADYDAYFAEQSPTSAAPASDVVSQLNSGDENACVNPSVTATVTDIIMEKADMQFSSWTGAERDAFLNGLALNVANVMLVGIDQTTKRVSCQATFQALPNGEGRDGRVAYDIQPELGSDKFMVSIPDVRDAVTSVNFARSAFWQSSVKPRLDAENASADEARSWQAAANVCASVEEDGWLEDPRLTLQSLPAPQNERQTTLKRCLENKQVMWLEQQRQKAARAARFETPQSDLPSMNE